MARSAKDAERPSRGGSKSDGKAKAAALPEATATTGRAAAAATGPSEDLHGARLALDAGVDIPPFVAGLVGGILGWFVTQFIAEPLRQFFGMRRDIAQRLLDYDNVSAPRNERGDITEQFTEQNAVRLGDAQRKLRELATQTLSFVQTNALAANLIQTFWRYDLVKAGRSLIGLSNTLAVYGGERARHRKNILDALRLKPLA